MNYKSIKVSHIKADEQENIISGYASHFNNKDSHGDIITKGAFAKTIKENMNRVKVLWQHDIYEPIGKPQEMYEDDKGLFTISKISQTDVGKKTMILARDGVLNEMSIGFYPVKEKYDEGKKANVISEIKLMEYSIVTLASNSMATFTDVKHLVKDYAYSKGNIVDILVEAFLEKIKALKIDVEPSFDTQIKNDESLEDTEIDQLILEIKKMRKG